jgi:formate transporter
MSRRSSATELDERVEDMEQRKHTPLVNMQRVDAYSPPEALKLVTQAGLAKAAMPWADLAMKSFLGGAFISLGALFDLVVAGI